MPPSSPTLAAPAGRLRTVGALALWPVLENALRWAVEATDTFVAGHQPHALVAADAVGVTTYLDWFMGLMQAAVGVGVTALVARATGARHRGAARFALGQGLVLGLAAGTLSALAALAQPLFALQLTLGGALRGAGDTRPQALFNAATLMLLRLPLAWFLGLFCGLGLLGVWSAMMAELGVRGAFATWRFHGGKWARVKV